MKRALILSSFVLLAFAAVFAQQPQTQPAPDQTKEADDKLRRCINAETRNAQVPSDGRPIMSENAMGNNPQEKQYREEMERLVWFSCTLNYSFIKKSFWKMCPEHGAKATT
ncbi:MAG: hypothetical protein K8S54_09800 [Spirochaetia bacterium]|nr:hypothetical protein [Spirochaetia bacterium]